VTLTPSFVRSFSFSLLCSPLVQELQLFAIGVSNGLKMHHMTFHLFICDFMGECVTVPTLHHIAKMDRSADGEFDEYNSYNFRSRFYHVTVDEGREQHQIAPTRALHSSLFSALLDTNPSRQRR